MTFKPATSEQIREFNQSFTVSPYGYHMPAYEINAYLEWRITGTVRLARFVELGVLPVKFHTVQGSFIANQYGLTSLTGFPTRVEGDLLLDGNELKDLVGAPAWVGGRLDVQYNPLTSLVGFPHHVVHHVMIHYSAHLPLLRLLNAHGGIYLMGGRPSAVSMILQKYTGEGKPGAIRAAAELIKAGYKENARW
jgi:hypothetical protein